MIRLGVDLGGRRVGLAICDAEEIVASPLGSLSVKSLREAVLAVTKAAADYGAGEVVVGLPLSMNGRRGPKAREAEAFADQLRQAGLNVILQDERLTTAEAERALKASGMGRRERKKVVDACAAQRLLATRLELARLPNRRS